MKLIRRILRYLILLVFIITIGCAYYYRSLIFSEIINTYVDDTVNRVLVWANIVPEQDEPATGEIQTAQGVEEDREEVAKSTETRIVKCECEVEISNLEIVAAVAADQAMEDEPVQMEAEEQVPELDAGLTTDTETEQLAIEKQAVIEEPGFDADVDQVIEEAPVQAEPEEQMFEREIDQAIDEETEQPQTDDGSDIGMALENDAPNSHSELINQARLLHLTGNTSNAIDLYRELAELYPDDPNVVGELGNVFYLKGDWEQASLAYYEAALRLQKLRMTEQIHYLYLVIHGLDPDVAEKLRGQLES